MIKSSFDPGNGTARGPQPASKKARPVTEPANDLVCENCGVEYGYKEPSDTPAWREGVCAVCKEKKLVTKAKDYGLMGDWPND